MTATTPSPTTGRSRTLAWFGVGCVAAVIGLDRLVVLLFDIHGAQIAVPGGPYHGDDLTDRTGDQIDLALLAVTLLLVWWALWSFRDAVGRSARLAVAVVVAVLGTASMTVAYFLTPLTFSLSPGATDGDDLTFGQAPGPLWYQVARPVLSGLAALALIAVAIRSATEPRDREPAVGEAGTAQRNRFAVAAAVTTIATATGLLGFNLLVAVIASTSPNSALWPVTVLAPLAALSMVLAWRHSNVVGTAILAPLWCGAAVWLVFTNPLTLEPSPVDDATRAAIEGWAAPALLVAAGLIVAAQTVAVAAAVRRGSRSTTGSPTA